MELPAEARRFLEKARVAHLATADRDARPHVVPVCFAVLDAATLVFAIDDKPKPSGRRLKRLKNLAENDRYALVVDRWDENWQRLAYVLIRGRARAADDPARRMQAIARLRDRYPQYRTMGLSAERHQVIELAVESVHCWGDPG